MIDVNDNYKLVNDLLSKNNGVYLTPDEYNRYAEIASLEYFDTLVGSKNTNRSVYGINRTLDRRLKEFREVAPTLVEDGVAELPDNCELLTAVYTDDYIPLRQTDEDRFARLMQDPLASPTEDDPVYKEINEYIEVFPETLPSVTIEYLRKPLSPKYAYTVENRRAVYNPTNSVHFEWNKRDESELTMRILQLCGISVGSPELLQVGLAKQQNDE